MEIVFSRIGVYLGPNYPSREPILQTGTLHGVPNLPNEQSVNQNNDGIFSSASATASWSSVSFSLAGCSGGASTAGSIR